MITTYHTPTSMRESGEIWLGRQGEKFARRLVFDCEEWLAEYTDAQIELSVTPPKGAMYFAVLQEDGDKRYWDVTSADTTYDGRANLELILRDSVTGTIIKSATAAAKISRSRSAQEPAEPPEPHVPWWERVLEMIAGGGGGNGTPAVSPTITLTAIEGGTRLTVNDVNGTRSADIMNGATGPEGPQGKTGATGATGAQGVAGRGIVDITSNVYDGTPVDVKYSDGTGTVFYVKNGRDGETPDVDVFPAIDGSGTTVQIGDVSFFIPHGKDGKDGAPGESYKLTAADKDEIAEKIVEGGGVTDAQIEAAVGGYFDKNPINGAGVYIGDTAPDPASFIYWLDTSVPGENDETDDPTEPDEPVEPDEPTEPESSLVKFSELEGGKSTAGLAYYVSVYNQQYNVIRFAAIETSGTVTYLIPCQAGKTYRMWNLNYAGNKAFNVSAEVCDGIMQKCGGDGTVLNVTSGTLYDGVYTTDFVTATSGGNANAELAEMLGVAASTTFNMCEATAFIDGYIGINSSKEIYVEEVAG